MIYKNEKLIGSYFSGMKAQFIFGFIIFFSIKTLLQTKNIITQVGRAKLVTRGNVKITDWLNNAKWVEQVITHSIF